MTSNLTRHNEMKMKSVYRSLLAFAAMCCIWSCSEKAFQEAEEFVSVSLNLAVEDIAGETKGTEPFIPDVENLIYNVWVIQYSNRGVYLTDTYFETGGVTEIRNKAVTLRTSDVCTLCLLVNAGPSPLGEEGWPDNLTSYKQKALFIDVNDLERTMMPMNGFYQGAISSSSHTLNVALGRMMTRINIVINNRTGEEITELVISLTDVPNKCSLFPSINYMVPDKSILPVLRDPLWGEESAVTLANEESKTYYYYIAPNMYGYNQPTRLYTTCKVGGIDMKADMTLSDDSPAIPESERDYRLYPNNNYTFTINLVNNE